MRAILLVWILSVNLLAEEISFQLPVNELCIISQVKNFDNDSHTLTKKDRFTLLDEKLDIERKVFFCETDLKNECMNFLTHKYVRLKDTVFILNVLDYCEASFITIDELSNDFEWMKYYVKSKESGDYDMIILSIFSDFISEKSQKCFKDYFKNGKELDSLVNKKECL